MLGRGNRRTKSRIDSLVHKPSRRQLRLEAMPEDLVEAALVMVEPLGRLVILAANVYDYVAGVENSRVSGPLEAYATQGERSPVETPLDVRIPASA